MKRVCIALGCVLCVCVIAFWCGRIYSVNKAYIDDTVIYDVGETAYLNDLELRYKEAHIYTVDEYKKKFNTDNVNTLTSDDRMLCACINVKNTGDTALSWDDVIDGTSGGFQTLTWGSSVDPFTLPVMNVFTSEMLEPGADQDIWYMSYLSSLSFSKKTWSHIENEEFYFVPVLEPFQIEMKLDVQK